MAPYGYMFCIYGPLIFYENLPNIIFTPHMTPYGPLLSFYIVSVCNIQPHMIPCVPYTYIYAFIFFLTQYDPLRTFALLLYC